MVRTGLIGPVTETISSELVARGFPSALAFGCSGKVRVHSEKQRIPGDWTVGWHRVGLGVKKLKSLTRIWVLKWHITEAHLVFSS